ncbi:MAG TPA: S8 family serine peptidase [Solirubrobacterales bacterium]|nr:S8 family serine peptidase [Solirubrobacterales bacterium]
MTSPGKARHRRLVRSSLALALLASGLTPAIAHAMVGRSGHPQLSARLSELVKPAVRSAPHHVQDAHLSLPRRGPGSLVRRGNQVLVNVRFAEGVDLSGGAAELEAAGADVVHVSGEYGIVAAFTPPGSLPKLGGLTGVEGLSPVLAPIVAASTCHGLVTSEGDFQLGAESARNAFNLEGEGVTVGVLSDSFDTSTDPEISTTAADDVASGDLPGAANPCDRTDEVEVLQDFADPEEPTIDEGRAMAQIVHDLAPAADLAFATAYPTEFAFAENIRRLASPPAAGGVEAEVLVDDIAYLEEPFFQDGPVGDAIEEVTDSGVSYFTAAGNDNLIDEEGNDIASWETPEFRDAAACPAELTAVTESEDCLDFNPSDEVEDPTFGITVEPEETLDVDLQWAEPRFGVESDLDVFLLDDEDKPIPGGTCVLAVVGSCENNLAGGPESTEQPVEFFAWENESEESVKVNLVVNRCFGTCNPDANEALKPRLKFALLENGEGVSQTEYPESNEGDVVGPTIFGHAGSADAISVGAVPFNAGNEVEPYSSHGPVTHYFETADSELPAPPLAEPEEITKPDLVATDCGLTTFFLPTQTPGINRFCGTSAAAPHAAAVAALMRASNPTLSAAQIRTALAASARPVASLGPDVVGAGLVDAFDAVGRVALPPEVEITEGPEPLSTNPRPRVTFDASRPVTFFCSIDEEVAIPCSSPFVPATPLEDGDHTITVSGTDLAGRTGTSEPEAFTIDTTAPSVSIRKHPRKVVRTRKKRVKGRFLFSADEPGSTFLCRIDGSRFRECPTKLVRRFKRGRHRVVVKARDGLGNVGEAAAFSFRVEKKRKRIVKK